MRSAMRPGFALGLLATAVLTVAAMISLENVAVQAFMPHYERVTTDFSPAYLQRELRTMASLPPQTVFLGDSVLWGYRLAPGQTAVALLRARGCACRNLSFKSGSPANDYALLRLLESYGVRPRKLILEINQRVLNPADASYKSLHPAIAALAAPLLTAQDRAALDAPAAVQNGTISRTMDGLSSLYAMRSDIREHLYGDVDAAPVAASPVRADRFEGTYDLTPLSEANLGVRYLRKTLALARNDNIPVVAFTTPTNHALLHDYIDVPEYRANSAFLKKLVRATGNEVLDLDAAFAARDFIDNDHLTAEGNRKLADRLAPAVAR